MVYACMGKILWVDLARGTLTEESIPDEVYEKYLSGIGLAAYILYREMPARADALGEQNILAFVSGLLCGSGTVFTGRWMAAAKSPLTHTWGEANCGGNLVLPLKRCGYDGIFFRGISPQPVYLRIIDGRAELRDAAPLWGLDTAETEARLRAENGKASAVACIGPAGENLSLISGISNDYGRLAARSGLGAVMGSKRLKALVLKGKQKIEIADKERISALTRSFQGVMKIKVPLPAGNIAKYLGSLLRILPFQVRQDGILYKTLLQRWGTISMNQISIEMGDAPVWNWRGTSADFPLPASDPLDPDRITAHETRKYHCTACPLGCGGEMENENTEALTVHKPEYESVLALSGLLKGNDLQAVSAMNEMLNRAGMDTISAGGTLAFAMECYENGLLSREQADGLDLTWGNLEAARALLEKMIRREGIGALFADGSKTAARRLGANAEDFAIHAGGQELSMHDGRNDPGFALHYAVEPTPGRHTIGAQLYYEMFRLWTRVSDCREPPLLYHKNEKYRAPEEKGRQGAACAAFMQVINAIGGCLFGAMIGVDRLPVFEWLNAATGWQKTPDDYMRIGARIQTLKQAFNAREGVPLLHTINKRALGIPSQKKGANRGRSVDLLPLARAYWKAFDWDAETGEPTPACLQSLELSDLVR